LTASGNFAGIDCSGNDALTRWFIAATDIVGDLHEIVPYCHHNSNGLNQLDRYLGKLLTSPANLGNKLFGCQFAAYCEWCHSQKCAPRGRVLIAMKSLRFRVARERGKQLTLVNLLNLSPTSYKLSDVKVFVDRVRLCLVNLRPGEFKDDALMFTWLWERFKTWTPIFSKLEKIREAKSGSSKRSWVYLWTAITSYIDNYYEDENYSNLQHSLLTGRIAGAAAKSKKSRQEKKDEKQKKQDEEEKASAAAAKTKGKGKGQKREGARC